MTRAPGVVECANCGHDVIILHDRDGCHLTDCPCRVGWTQGEKRDYLRTWGYDS